MQDTTSNLKSEEAKAFDAELDALFAEQAAAFEENERYLARVAERNAARRAEEAAPRARYNVTTRYSIAPVATYRA